ncbi:TPA: hypothetical protein QCU24_005917, partial [Bacillus cereus]|nr:hypothetical protein [Bacillus cereus]
GSTGPTGSTTAPTTNNAIIAQTTTITVNAKQGVPFNKNVSIQGNSISHTINSPDITFSIPGTYLINYYITGKVSTGNSLSMELHLNRTAVNASGYFLSGISNGAVMGNCILTVTTPNSILNLIMFYDTQLTGANVGILYPVSNIIITQLS